MNNVCVPDRATMAAIRGRHGDHLAVLCRALSGASLDAGQKAASAAFIDALDSMLEHNDEPAVHLFNRHTDFMRVAALLPKPASPQRIPAPQPEPSKGKPAVAANGKVA